MTNAPADLASHRAFTASWSTESAQDDLRRWEEFLAAHGIRWAPDAAMRDSLDQVIRSNGSRGAELVELRLEKLANDALKEAGDPRRVLRLVSTEPGRRWYVLSPEERSSLEQAGHCFESAAAAGLRQLATIPITLGVYFAAAYACRAAGLSDTIAWGIALVAYVVTVRVVRGRWPLQRPR